MKAAAWFVVLVLSVSSIARAQEVPANDARVADAWMLHLEGELHSRVSATSYFGAPFALAEGLAFGAIGLGVPGISDWGRVGLVASAPFWLAAGIGYYATSDRERALLTYTALANVGSALLWASSVGWNVGCDKPAGECGDRVTVQEFRDYFAVNAIGPFVLSLLTVGVVLFSPPPRVADLRVGFAQLDPAAKQARLIDHLRERERLRRTFDIAATIVSGLSTVGFVYMATEAESSDGQLLGGLAAGAFGAITIGAIIWMLLETPDSERVLAGELPPDE